MEQNLNSSNLNLPEEDNMDVKRYISMFISNWYWFAGTLFIAMSLAYGINRYSQRAYSVSSTLLIKDDQIGAMNSNTVSVIPGGDIFKRQQNLKNEMGILKSYSLNYMTMKELPDFHIVYIGVGKRGIVQNRMYKSAPFIVVYDSLEHQTLGQQVGIKILSEENYLLELDGNKKYSRKIKFGEKFSEQGFDFIILPRNPEINVFNKKASNNYYFYFDNPTSLAYSYSGNLSVAPIEKEASLVTLTITGLEPQQEADYLNKLMDVYINYGLEMKNQTADSTIKFIDRQLKTISDSLSVAEEKLEKFQLANNFFNLSSEGSSYQIKMSNYENSKATFELQLMYYSYLSEYLNNKNSRENIISPALMGITDATLFRLINEFSSLQEEKGKLGFNLEVNQPAVELLNKSIDEKREALIDNVKNGIAAIHLSINEEEKKIQDVELKINKLPTTEKKLIGIQRKFDLNNTVYTYLLEKRAESGIAKASNVSENRIIDQANSNSASIISPKTKVNYIMAFILGLLFPMVWIVLVDYFNDKVIDKKDIERKTKVPIIGYISHSGSLGLIPVIEKLGSSFAESFRSVRTAIKFFIKEKDSPIIIISSTIVSEGKTFVSINLAAIMALLGKKVLLVGLDLRKPKINKAFNFEESPGMSTFLSGNCSYEEIIKSTQVKNLFYAPSGPIPPNPAELLEKTEMKMFFERAREEFNYIIIDTPPIAVVSDTLLIAPYADLSLFIVRQRFSSRGTLDIINHLYEEREMKNMAIIINDINISGYYGYGLRYGDAMGYGYYYGYNYYGKGYYGQYGNSNKSKGYYTEE